MRILFIHKYDYHEPLGIMTLSAYLKNRGHHCELLDVKLEKNYIKQVQKYNPDIIAYSVLTVNQKFYSNINKKLKTKFNFISVFGGAHTTFYPEFINNDGVDIICIGEGEQALAELVDKLERQEDYSKIKNLYVKKNGHIYKNELRDLISNLDDIPFPDRDLINKYNHYKHRTRVRTITSRGCPFNCTYCFNHSYKALFKNKGIFVRQRSVDNVIKELVCLKNQYNPINIEFHDDVFILDKKWVDEFVIKYKKQINIPYDISLRVDLVKEEIIEKLKFSGCKCIHFGIESGNFDIRKNILNRNITDEQIIKAALLFKKYDIKTKPFNIVGLPGETLENVYETISLNIKCKVSYAINTIYHPYPQTVLAKYAIDNNYYNGDINEIDKSLFYGKSAIKTHDIHKIVRLHYLFAFCVKTPWFIPISKILVLLPFDAFYRVLFFLYRAYSVIFIYKQLSIKEIFISEPIRKISN